jgi:glycosyltransferase involved in cell wall biosynthesis
MGALVGEFDLQAPQAIWSVEGYPRAQVLFRNAGVPIGWMPVQLRQAAVLTVEELKQVAEDSGILEFALNADPTPYSKPSITVIVCTRDRPMTLRRCLASLNSLRYDNLQVLVVDNASRSSETKDVVAEAQFQYLRENKPGLDWARNCGLQAASTEIVAYTDDDVKVDSNWLNAIARGFSDPQVSCVTGLVCPIELQTEAQVLFEENGGMRKGLWPRSFERQNIEDNPLIATQLCGVGANMAFRREALLEVGGFDIHLDVGTPSHGSGDLDIFHRLHTAGKLIRYEPSAVVWHQHRRSMPALYKQFYDNGRAFGCYLLKTLSNRTLPVKDVVRFVVTDWIGSWMFFGERPGRRPMLVAAEIWGMLHAPWAFWKTYRRIPLLSRVPSTPLAG